MDDASIAPYEFHFITHLFVELLLRCLANQRSASHADSRSNKRNAQRFP